MIAKWTQVYFCGYSEKIYNKDLLAYENHWESVKPNAFADASKIFQCPVQIFTLNTKNRSGGTREAKEGEYDDETE